MRRPGRPLRSNQNRAINDAAEGPPRGLLRRLLPARRLTWPAALWLGLVGAAAAQAPARDVYFGAGVGRLAYKIRSNGESFLDTSSGLLKLYGGFRLARDWGFEASYEVTQTAHRDGLPPGSWTTALPSLSFGDPTTAVRVEIATLRAVRYASFDWGSVYAGFGVSGASIDSELRVDAGLPVAGMFHSASNGLTIAAGTQWNFASLSLRLEYEWWHTDMRGVGVSLHWRE